MTLEQAIEVAREVESDKRFHLVSIGKFVPVEEVCSATRWGVALQLIGAEKPVVAWDKQAWDHFRGVTKPSEEKPRDAKFRSQPSLF